MRYRLRIFLILMLLCSTCSVAWGGDSWDMWNAYFVNVPLLEKEGLSWFTLFETRFRDDITDFYRYHFYLGPVYKTWQVLTLYEHVNVTLYYMWLAKRGAPGAEWSGTSVFGTALGYNF